MILTGTVLHSASLDCRLCAQFAVVTALHFAQGTFKQAVSMDNLVYGMEFDRQLSNLPAPWFIENMLLPLARKISPSLRVGTLDDPFFFSPMITASQVSTDWGRFGFGFTRGRD
jgi:hypothetical protein